jgi:divalent metal cation (Fe/Co/Zn/Cd) transporter
MKPFDTWLTSALLGFVVGIPCLAVEFYMSTIATRESQHLGEKLVTAAQIMTFRFVADFVGFIGAAVGIVAYVGHLASWAAWVFLLVIPALLALYGALLYLIGLGHAIRERGRNAPPGH